ncbi:MAG: hypothetical protein ABIU97_02990 [Dehalococcoidia bacterium]
MNDAVCFNHFEANVGGDAPPPAGFGLLDDHRRLSAHMTEPSCMMAGARIAIGMDEL